MTRKAKDGTSREYLREWRKKNPEKYSAYIFNSKMKKYGITPRQYKNMIEGQNKSCKICAIKFSGSEWKRKPCIDHCHKTGKVRDLLCQSCNVFIGYSKESIKILEAAIRYIKKWK